MDTTPEFTTPDVYDASGQILLAISQAEEEQKEAGEEVLGATEDEIVERIAKFTPEDRQEAAVIASRLRIQAPDLGKGSAPLPE